MKKFAYATENEFVVAFLNEEYMQKAIERGRKLEPVTPEVAKEKMIEQIAYVGSQERGRYGEWVRNLDFTDKTAEQTFTSYAHIVKEEL